MDKDKSISQRLTEFCKYKGMGVSVFEKRSGLSNGYVKNIGKTIGYDKRLGIEAAFPELNMEWVMKGTGDMLNPSPPAHTNVYSNVNTGNVSSNVSGGNVVVGAAGDVSACLDVIRRMQDLMLVSQRQAEESQRQMQETQRQLAETQRQLAENQRLLAETRRQIIALLGHAQERRE